VADTVCSSTRLGILGGAEGGGTMIVHLSIHTPKPEHVEDVAASMGRFGAAAAGQPGLREVHTLRDESSGKLVGLAIWESREAFEAGVISMRTAVEDDPFEDWEENESEVYLLEET
jgi:heme-degrading monooxygenase HmoA